MCGFAGFLTNSERLFNSFGNPTKILKLMNNQIIKRGPDTEGYWLDPNKLLGLSHRRLAIQDLSNLGHQPMLSNSKRYVVAFNGEIYNYLDLGKKLISQGYTSNFKGNSDTEVLISIIECYGFETAIKLCKGMFALAVYDTQEKYLYLCRDRFGEKPLYYGWQNSVFLFGSELKALKAHPGFIKEIDRNSLALHMKFGYVPSPYSIYKNIRKLIPGTYLKVKFCSNSYIHKTSPKPIPYWSLKKTIKKGLNKPFLGQEKDAISHLDKLISNSVSQQMIADVPIGAFLSGGIDSSLISAVMQSHSKKPIKTFSIGFSEQNYNEAIFAKEVALFLGTDHSELYVSPKDAIEVIPKLPEIYDEPFSDSSQIPTYLLSKMTRENVTVSLSGDGGDELFGGYNRYILTKKLWKKFSIFPLGIRSILGSFLVKPSPEKWDQTYQTFEKLLPYSLKFSNFGDKVHKGAKALKANNINSLYTTFVSHWDSPNSIVIGGSDSTNFLTKLSYNDEKLSEIEKMMALDTISYLPDDILTKVDRAAMSVSLETRIPFLDHDIADFAWSLPLSMKIRGNESKWILKQLLYKYIPKNLIERPKMGFGIPLDIWLRGPLRDWAETLLDKTRLKNECFLEPSLVEKKWREHLSGARNWQSELWNVLMFQSWLEKE